MASILRQIVAGPRAQHPEAGFDLCYVTDHIVVTSGPSSEWPKKAYRNPVDQLVAFLDKKHGQDWCIFEFRAEGSGYPDSEVHGRVHHFPWPDHQPPPFAILPNIMAAMRNWIKRLDGEEEEEREREPAEESRQGREKDQRQRVAVVHCKAGKGRSGTVTTAYLISEEGWKREDALHRFTTRRMRAGFGQGVSIPSQLRYVGYVDRWANKLGKKYVERAVEIVEVHIWGLSEGVKVAVDGYVDGGKTIKTFYTFTRADKTVVDQSNTNNQTKDPEFLASPPTSESTSRSSTVSSSLGSSYSTYSSPHTTPVQTVILKPASRVILPTSDVNIDLERRNRAGYAGFTMVTSVAHVWFNAYFEGGSEGYNSGVFEIDWNAMDGIKGSRQKGIQALDRLKVVWKYADEAAGGGGGGHEVVEPAPGCPVPESKPADPQPDRVVSYDDDAATITTTTLTPSQAPVSQDMSVLPKELGLQRFTPPESANSSCRASSFQEEPQPDKIKTKNKERQSAGVEEGGGEEKEKEKESTQGCAKAGD